jgi:molybdate transport system ATP-binding protein
MDGLVADVHVTVGHFDLTAQIDARPGETVAIIGPNGAGKTTFLRALAGLLTLTHGRITLNGEVVDDPAAGTWVPPERRRIGIAFQDDVLFPHLSALDNVAFGLVAQGRSKADARRVAMDWLERVGLSGRSAVRPDRLSGGEVQRVALVRALVTEPALVILDEPFSALDVTARREIREEIQRHLSGLDAPRMIITHDPVDAAAVADRLVVVENGTVVQDGTLAEMTARPRSRYVADFVGTNLLHGRARGTTVDVDSTEIVTAADADGDVFITIPPRAVVLSASAPVTSARNAWAGRVEAIETTGPAARVSVRAAIDLVAEVTPASVEALSLHVGAPVWVSVKATEITVEPI